jgi:hypothetical protein
MIINDLHPRLAHIIRSSANTAYQPVCAAILCCRSDRMESILTSGRQHILARANPSGRVRGPVVRVTKSSERVRPRTSYVFHPHAMLRCGRIRKRQIADRIVHFGIGTRTENVVFVHKQFDKYASRCGSIWSW